MKRRLQNSSRGRPSRVAINSLSRSVAGASRQGNSAMKATPACCTRLPDFVGGVRIQVERGGTVNRLTGVAGGEDRQRAVPASGEQQHGVDVAA